MKYSVIKIILLVLVVFSLNAVELDPKAQFEVRNDLRCFAIEEGLILSLIESNQVVVDLTMINPYPLQKGNFETPFKPYLLEAGKTVEDILNETNFIHEHLEGRHVIKVFTYSKIFRFRYIKMSQSPLKDYILKSGDVILVGNFGS